MKVCPSCSVSNANDAAFCIGCGFPLSAVAADGRDDGRAATRSGYLAQGSIVDGKYQIERVLGEGGMGVVYLARDIHTEMEVVIKSIRAEFADRPEFRARTLAEGRALAKIDHPNVVRLNAVVAEGNALYLVMQFIDGETLEAMIARHVAERRPVGVDEALAIFRMIVKGVGAAHAEGLIHRDLKPANVLIRKKDGVAKVTDFGIAKGEEDAKAGRGVTKGIIGSISYMAPEQVRGQRDLDKRVDIYALGIVLFELLIGRAPFDSPSDYEIMRMHSETPLPSVTEQRHDVPPYLDRVLARACAKDREARFSSCAEFLAALDLSAPAMAYAAPGAAPAKTVPLSAPLPFADAPHVVAHDSSPAPAAGPPLASVAFGSVTAPPPGHTGEGASLPPGPSASRRRRSGSIWVLALGTAAAAAATSVYLATSKDVMTSQAKGQDPTPPKPSTSSNAAERTTVEASAPKQVSPEKEALLRLAGAWRSTSNRDFSAVVVDDAVEFRIVDPDQHPRTGYQSGEVRFRLSPVSGSPLEFTVEDRLRPTPPGGSDYDTASRESCVSIWTKVKGKELKAEFDGASTLTVEVAQIRTASDKFKLQGGRVVRCAGLDTSPAEIIESKLTRVP